MTKVFIVNILPGETMNERKLYCPVFALCSDVISGVESGM